MKKNRVPAMKITSAAVIFTAMILAGCSNVESPEFAGLMMERLEYAQDPTTGLCFAITYTDGLAHVPCTPEVLERIK